MGDYRQMEQATVCYPEILGQGPRDIAAPNIPPMLMVRFGHFEWAQTRGAT